MCTLISKLRILRIVGLLLFISLPVSSIAETESDKQDALFAKRMIVDILYIDSTKNMYKVDSDISGVVSNSPVMAIKLLSKLHGQTSERVLAELTCLSLDGALSEAHSCAVWKKGRKMLPRINRITVAKCKIINKNLVKYREKYAPVKISLIAASNEEIIRNKKELIQGLKKKVSCKGEW